ncbi:MAG: efflux RND transporter permease subunit [Gammaproteobacteria bacterium]|nr:MAG: efflux RND transporter permease subunit [Gammaproteobacteria bacterium]
MTRLIGWFVGNPVAANLLMMILVVGGLISLTQLKQEEFPEIDLGIVQVRVPYLGAAPEEVELGVCIRIEEALEGAQSIYRMTSASSEGMCTVTLELESSADDIEALNDISGRVDAISTFPAETERPIVSLLTSRNQGLEIVIAGDTDERTLKTLALEMREEIAAMDGISQVEVAYVRADEISIEVSEQTLRRYGLTLDQVANAVRRSSLDLPGGTIRAGGGEILVRTKGQAYRGSEFENIVVVSAADGTTITLGEIATIVDGLEEGDLSVRFDGQPAAMVAIYQVGSEDIIDIRDKVRAYVENAQARMPEGIELTIWRDESEELEARLSILLATAVGGLALVLLLLSLPLQFRLAMWVAAGIPIAMLGTIALFIPLGITLSTMSVIAFILVLGIVVDDAIVVGERIYAHERHAENQHSAAIEGTAEVAVPVIFGVLTTMAAFLPIMLLPGRIGSLFSVLGYIVVICLVFSVIESQLILPSHLAHRRIEPRAGRPNAFVARWLKFQERLAAGIEDFAERRYGEALSRVLEWRYLVLAVGVGILTLTLALVVSGRISVEFFPSIAGDRVVARLTMPEGIAVAETTRAARQIEQAAQILRSELDLTRQDQPSVIQHVLTTIGQGLAGGQPGGGTSLSTPVSHRADVAISLVPAAERSEFPSDTIAERWRELTGPIADSVELTFSASQLSAGDAISIQLRGRNVDDLAAAAADLRAELSRFVGVADVSDSFRSGKQEVRLSLRPEAQHLGLTLDDLARQVRQAFYGEEAQRVQRGTEDVRVMVRYPETERRSLGDLEDMRIRTSDGTEVPFAAAAEFTLGQGYSTITRINRQRVVTVRADVNRSITTPEAVLNSLAAEALPRIVAGYRGVTYSLTGEQEERAESFGGMARLFPVALLIMYALLAIPLRSYLQPLIIMSGIPFGAVGAIVGHLMMGWSLALPSILGMIALSGVVVNSSLVLVDYINRQRRTGVPVLNAVRRAGVVRFRPIMLTSITTFAGLTPLMLIDNPATAFIIPMAISLGWGVLFATVITLFLVPSLVLILEDLRPATMLTPEMKPTRTRPQYATGH